jgi:replicative superfamily II helicase
MIKKGYAVQMTYDVSDAEKTQAEKALICFSHTDKLLDLASDHLNIMKTPFKNNPEMSGEDVLKARAAIRRFRDKSIENFNEFKKKAFECVNVMKDFSTDTQTLKLMKSFISSIDELEEKVNEFGDLFSDLEAKDFSTNIVKSIEEIQTQCEDVSEIIDERIKNHIQTNILATSWVDSVSSDLQLQVQEKTPLILDLFNQRQDQLNESIKERTSQPGN